VRYYKTKIAKKSNIEFILLSRDNNEKAAITWAKKSRFPFPVVTFADQKNNFLLNKYAARGIPHFVLIDKTGKVLATRHASVSGKNQKTLNSIIRSPVPSLMLVLNKRFPH